MAGRKRSSCLFFSQEQLDALRQLSQSYMAPYIEVVRARILLLSHDHPDWSNQRIAGQVGCARATVTKFRRRWVTEGSLKSHRRSGAPRKYPPLVRTQITALACSKPSGHHKPWQRWSSGKLAQVAHEEGLSASVSASTIGRWLRQDKIKPWHYHLWQKSKDPHFVEKAAPVLALYEQAPHLAQQGEVAACVDEKTSIQARKPFDETQPAIPGQPVRVAARYRRMGAVQLFCALLVARGLTHAATFAHKCFADFKAFLVGFFTLLGTMGTKVLDLILDNGSTHAPKQLGGWIASLQLSFEVHLFWLPTYASWLDQVEIIFSKVTRDALTPNDFEDTKHLEDVLMRYFAELNEHPKPIEWSYTKEKMAAKFAPPPPLQLAA
jgi:transposase